ncbi:hypothetical protein Trydic_g15071 [Trypoxylus dichotomus]
MTFLTPQSRKIHSPGTRLSLSSNNKIPEQLLGSLLNDPVKRVLLMEVLSQDKSKENVKGKKLWKKPTQQKFKFESPTALCRRRALEKMRRNSDSSDSIDTNHGRLIKKIPFEQLLKGVVAYVEIMSNNIDRSAGAKSLMRAMGADIRSTITRDVTHVVFKDGTFRTYQKAKLLKVHVVSVLWIEAVRKNMYRVPERNYPALGVDAADLNTSLICQQFQREYADVLEDELNRTKNLNVLPNSQVRENYTADIIDTSQNTNVNSITSTRNNLRSKETTPASLYLDSTPELTSDSEAEYQSKKRVSRKLFKHKRLSKCNINKENTEGDIKKDVTNQALANNHSNIDRNKCDNETCIQSMDLSSLQISMESNEVKKNLTPPQQKILNYDNVTERKRRPGKNKRISILENIIVGSPKMDEGKAVGKTRLFEDVLIKKVYSDDMEDEFSSSPIKKKTVRKLYNVDDSVPSDHEPYSVPKGDNKNEKKIIRTNTNENKGVKDKPPVQISAAPSRRSMRVKENEGDESPSKKARSKSDVEGISSDECDNLIKNKGSVSKKKTKKTEEVSDSSEDFENSPKRTPQKKSPSKIDLPPKSSSKNLKSAKNTSASVSPINNAVSSTMKFKKIIPNPVTDSCDEFVQPDVSAVKRNNSVAATENESISSSTQKTPARRSMRLLSARSIQDDNIPPSQRRSTQDFVPKTPFSQTKSKNNPNMTRTKSNVKNKNAKRSSIVCTRFHNAEVQVFQQIVKKLGVFFVEDEVSEKTTHLVAAEPRRTVNLLRAIARGCWVVRSEWLYRSLEARDWLPEEHYELTEFSIAVQKARQERQTFGPRFSMDIFENCGKIYISRGTNPRCSDLQELVTLCKGSVTSTTRNADIVVGEYVEDKSCVIVNWIMDSITFYKRKSLRNYIIPHPDSDAA